MQASQPDDAEDGPEYHRFPGMDSSPSGGGLFDTPAHSDQQQASDRSAHQPQQQQLQLQELGLVPSVQRTVEQPRRRSQEQQEQQQLQDDVVHDCTEAAAVAADAGAAAAAGGHVGDGNVQ